MEDEYELCPLCGLKHPQLVHNFNESYEADVIGAIKTNFPGWNTKDGICGRCFDVFEAITYHPYSSPNISLEEYKLPFLDFYIFPIAERLNADETYTGKGVTICFIDRDFYLHDDIKERVVKLVDVTDDDMDIDYFLEPHENGCQGTTGATVCAGDGKLSNGLYKGLASDANLILIKTQSEDGQINDRNILDALQWVKDNHVQFNIKIINLSLNGTTSENLDTTAIDLLAEELFAENVLVIAAADNSTDATVLPPASSPHVVAVGGLEDEDKLDGDIILYYSNYGVTVDGLSKPEIISNAVWIPTPILPGSSTHQKAAALFQALQNEDYMAAIIENNKSILKEDHVSLYKGKEKIWKEVKKIFWKEKFITPHYVHADGSSFVAPIVSSVAAQMLEANPCLTANEIRMTLLKTAIPIPTYDITRQGYGRLQPKMAIYAVMRKQEVSFTEDNPVIDCDNGKITFYIHLPAAKTSVSLVGSFTNWKKNEILLMPARNNVWFVHIPILKAGRYEYKFFVDNNQWEVDRTNPWRVIDNYGGWNNAFEIKSA